MYEEEKIRTTIIDDFNCLQSDLDTFIEYYKTETKKYVDENCRGKMLLASEEWEKLLQYKQKVKEMLDEFNSLVESKEENTDGDFVNYQNFANTRPLQIKLFGNTYDVDKNWRRVLLTVCEELINKYPEICKTLDQNPAFKGSKRKYFSYNPEELTNYNHMLSNGLYVELNSNANQIVDMCRKLLLQCGCKPEDLKFKIESNS